MTIPSRIRDFVHELRIAWLFARYRREVRMAFDTSRVRSTWNKYTAAINARSPEQLRRLARKRDA